ncbi:Fumarylacetoacetase, protein [Pleurostoma richardsiae]|uniref:Fumarylacetoacetase, protein n=1 Tax=Pleurostoma richardsiae TaxID=41990 RepID=A0AA38RHR5_9PEZI|nr:Fumarylacetoacetase, protein [Pleurostoma richardsiae]
MPSFSHLVRFESEDGKPYYADLGPQADGPPSPGAQLDAFASLDDIASKTGKRTLTVCRLSIPSYPPLWTKPAASLAHPDEDIPVNDFCARSLLDYEGELVFVTSKTCRDVSQAEAKDYILGYTVGNDLSCRMFQIQKNSGGQFFYAKAFDHFAPIGPTLISPEIFESGIDFSVVTKVNGVIRQKADLKKDMIFSPERILSHMSQGTTIPAGTAVMTGTPEGVGAFRRPKTFLQHGDVVEVEMHKVGTLRNKINFE